MECGTASVKNQNGDCSKNNLEAETGAGTISRDDIIIVGAGVVGSALAYTLGKDRHQVHVIERDLTEGNRIVGELLQPGGYQKLIEIGLQDCLKEIDAQKIFGYVIYMDGKKTKLAYPSKTVNPDLVGTTFHHGRFIQRMRAKASSLPNVRLEQGTVTSLLEENGSIKGVQYRCRGNQQEFTAFAPLTIVCDGSSSSLRRSLCNPKVDIPSYSIGLVLEHSQLPFRNHTHVILADPSPIVFYPISSTEIRCLVDFPGQQVPSISTGEMATYLKTKVAPQVPPELYNALVAAIDKGNIKSMPNKRMPGPPEQASPRGGLLMGDAANMRHPITAGGMTVALSDVVVLRNLLTPLHNLNDSPSLWKHIVSFYTLRKPVVFTMNTFAGATYKVLCTASKDPARKEMQQALFDYLSLGCVFSNGPLDILSGLNTCPLSMFLYLSFMGSYAIGRLLLPFPSPNTISTAAKVTLGALKIIFPIIKDEGIRAIFPV